VLLTAAGLALLLGAMASAIVFARQEAKEQLDANFKLRGQSSAGFISTFLLEQGARERHTAREMLSRPRVPAARLQLVEQAFGSRASVLLDGAGRLLDVLPADPALRGQEIASRYSHLRAAERGRVAVSGVVPSAARHEPVIAIAVPFATPAGRRVFSAAYPLASSTLAVLVNHTIAYRQHQVFLLDGTGKLVAASPATRAATLSAVAPALARAVAARRQGPVRDRALGPGEFTAAPVPGSSWQLVIAVPDSRLYASISGWSARVPWIVFALVALFGVGLLVLLARSQRDRARLAILSATLEETARTDALTGLHNRRALAEGLRRTALHAARHGQPFAVLMIDLDRFKETNDRHGHEAGDRVLRAVAACMRDVCRGDDIYGRWGGDEFLVAMAATDREGARALAERLSAAACRLELPDIGLPEGVSLSIGGASGTDGDPDQLVQAADAALYQSKSSGRGRITIAPAPLAHAAAQDPRGLLSNV
jgi:diguanylate cyclase (GGDEF)-like protein